MMGVNQATLRRWRGKDFSCSCPWHNWDELVVQREHALKERMDLLDDGIEDPVQHHNALMNIDTDQPLTEEESRRVRKELTIIRSDLERIKQLERLFSKLYFHATGIVLDYDTLLDLDENMETEDDVREFLLDDTRGGLQPKNLEGCVRVLLSVMEKINELKVELGIRGRTRVSTSKDGDGEVKEETRTVEENRPVTINDLRSIRDQIVSMPREAVEAMANEIRARDEACI